jgi:hypothetical protein
VKHVKASSVFGRQLLKSESPLSPSSIDRRSGLSSVKLIYNYNHYMYGALWVAGDALDGEKGTVCGFGTACVFSSSLLGFTGLFAGAQPYNFA